MIGTLLGNRYELIEKIGEGGMAEVYRAKCHSLNRYVSLKILKAEYSNDKDFVDKFMREASSAASLSDHNIVNIYDVGSQGNINYIVMEYIKGKTLKEIINQEEKLSYYKAIDIAIQIAKALDCAHKNNIIHRDIKPHNILVTEDGVAKVTDFGIAKAASSVTITNTSKVMGSAHYFSPEQAKGSFVDFRTDIYSLGIVMYEMVTGRVPYDAESPVSVALKHIQEPVVPPKQLNDKIPESLNKLILKSIEKEPIKRYQSIKDMLVDLEKIRTNSNVNIVMNNFEEDYTRVMDPVLVDGEEENSSKKVDNKSKKIIIASLAVFLVILLGGFLGYMYFSGKNGPSSPIGNKEVVVPDILGKTREEAKQMVTSAGLKFTEAETRKSEKPAGVVIDVYPQPGQKVKGNTEVRVYISAGPEASKLPSFKDMDLGTAKIMIANAGLKLGDIKEENSETVPKGYIISQTPEADTDVAKDTKINLVVSKGPTIIKTLVPKLVDLTLDKATTLINTAKLNLNPTISYVSTPKEEQDNIVIAQDIQPDTSVPVGTSIRLTVYKYEKPASVEKIILPNFVNKTYSEIETKINELKTKYKIKFVYTDVKGVPKTPKPTDIVDSQLPLGNAEIKEGDTVTIILK